jgi:hypothetical protein
LDPRLGFNQIQNIVSDLLIWMPRHHFLSDAPGLR